MNLNRYISPFSSCKEFSYRSIKVKSAINGRRRHVNKIKTKENKNVFRGMETGLFGRNGFPSETGESVASAGDGAIFHFLIF